MTQATFVRELFEIPERVHQGDYVLKLTEGLQNPEETAGLYVTTPKLIDAFDRALGLVGDALKSGQSKATYLHGSFGSGKSHFMAMLSLLLQGHEAAWRLGDFHPLREKYPDGALPGRCSSKGNARSWVARLAAGGEAGQGEEGGGVVLYVHFRGVPKVALWRKLVA